MSAAGDERISVVIPVYNEAENIGPCLRELCAALSNEPHELLVCYDHDGDTTLPAIAAMGDAPPTLRLVKNDLGPGVAFAMRAGLAAATGDVVVTYMADRSDPADVILAMAAKIRRDGADVVSGSRYMLGGRQIGGPLIKRTLSRWSGRSLQLFTRIGTCDPTTNFRAYSRRLLTSVTIESTHGFELGLELTVKSHLAGLHVSEVPSVWRDRTVGQSRFRLWRWLPQYLRWYVRAVLNRPASRSN